MKAKISVVLALFFSFSSVAQSGETVSINDALKQKMIVVNGQYNDNSVHYLRPVILSIISLISRPIKLKIESGHVMVPQDSACQTMMITGDTLFVIKPKQTIEIEPYGMCIEPHDRSGNAGLKYSYKPNSNQKLIAIAQYISQNKLNDYPGQRAVWCVAYKDKTLLEIDGYDSSQRMKLIFKVAAITGKKMPTPQELRKGYDSYIQTPKETIGGTFEFKFAKAKKVHVAMFNAQGTVVRELYFNANEKPGVHKVNFEFDYTVYTDEYYDIKLIADDEVLLTSRVDKNYEDWEEE